MPLSDMKAFFRFLDQADDEDLVVKRDRLVKFIEEAKDKGVRKDACYLLRKVEEEILSRL